MFFLELLWRIVRYCWMMLRVDECSNYNCGNYCRVHGLSSTGPNFQVAFIVAFIILSDVFTGLTNHVKWNLLVVKVSDSLYWKFEFLVNTKFE